MTPADFIAWRRRLGLTQSAAAEALGLTASRISDYEMGRTRGSKSIPAPIPRAVELACAHIERGEQ